MQAAFAVLNAFLWRMGGAGVGPWRKVGWPVLVALQGLLAGHSPIQVLAAISLAVFAVTRPFTYFGEEIRGHWFNWVWIWCLGLYLCGPSAALGRWNLWPLAWSLAATLSNVPATARVFRWEFCECLVGVTVFL